MPAGPKAETISIKKAKTKGNPKPISRTLSWPRDSQEKSSATGSGAREPPPSRSLVICVRSIAFRFSSCWRCSAAARSSRRLATSRQASAVARSSFVQFADSFPTVPRTRSPDMTGRASTAAIAASTCATLRWVVSSLQLAVDFFDLAFGIFVGCRNGFASADECGAILRVDANRTGKSPHKAQSPDGHEAQRKAFLLARATGS